MHRIPAEGKARPAAIATSLHPRFRSPRLLSPLAPLPWRRWGLLWLCWVVSAAAAPAGWDLSAEEAKAQDTPQILAQYVLMAPGGLEGGTVPLVRVILAQPVVECPSLVLSDGRTLPLHRRTNPNPAAFGVAVCEAAVRVKEGVTARIVGQTKTLPLPPATPLDLQRVVVVGDSGCKGGDKQSCSGTDTGPATWPFPAIASAAAETQPQLVIHVGDYNYSGTPNKTGAGQWSYDGCVPEDGGPLVHQSSYDTWTTWQADFFAAAEPLLAAAPWVVVRGITSSVAALARAGFTSWILTRRSWTPTGSPPVAELPRPSRNPIDCASRAWTWW